MSNVPNRIDANKHAYAEGVANAKSLAKSNKLSEGDCVLVEYRRSSNHKYKPEQAIVLNGLLTVNGCLPSPGMVGRTLSRPYRWIGGEWDSVIALADDTRLTRSCPHGDVLWLLDGVAVDLHQTILTRTPATPLTRTILVRDLVAFTGYPPDLLTCEVDSFGVIRVADSLSGTMTTCHAISETDQARIRAAVADGKQVI